MNEQVTGEEIINQFKNGNSNSLSIIFNLHYTPLCFFAERLIDDKEEAEDIVVNAFVKLWEARPEVRTMQSLKSYLYRVTRNDCFNYLRKAERTSKLRSDLSYLLSGRDQELESIIKAEIFDKIYNALNTLPPQCRKIAWMSFIDGLRNQQIADLLNISIHTVKNQKLRAISLLKMKLLDIDVLFILWLSTRLLDRN